ncbi:beta-microseminoprotein J1-like isoform X2 [Sminthopsis crassicaudata]|uniref:beta-microseminoprotein J1-like isoform X2 n=1 Tax=Sminthopsis crassicaudata TaxID=9301 RepID=UPI003D69EBC7
MLGVLLSLANFLIYCDAQCINTPLEIMPDAEVQGCRDANGIIHKFGSQWFSDCDHCICDKKFGQSCCNTVMKPLVYDKVKCKKVFQKETCSYSVIEKNNPSKACKVSMFIG